MTTSKVRLQSLRTLCTMKGFPVIELIKYCTAVIPSILTATTSVRAYLRMIALLAVKQEQMHTVDLFEN